MIALAPYKKGLSAACFLTPLRAVPLTLPLLLHCIPAEGVWASKGVEKGAAAGSVLHSRLGSQNQEQLHRVAWGASCCVQEQRLLQGGEEVGARGPLRHY